MLLMTDSGSSPGSNVRDTAEVVKGIVENVPVYEDAIQPAARKIGEGLETVASVILIALAPLKALVWGYEQFESFLSTKVAEKLSETPSDEIIEPKLHVAGPALEALRYTGHEEELSELYANLLAASMDARTASKAHPSFVEIIKQITPDEARLLKYFSTTVRLPLIDVQAAEEDGEAGYVDVLVHFSTFGTDAKCEHPHLTPVYLDNLARLGVIALPDSLYTSPGAYEELENHPSIVEAKEQINALEGRKAQIVYRLVEITSLGQQFMEACVVDHREL